MDFFRIFKKSSKQWNSYKNFLVSACAFPFTSIVSIDKNTDLIIDKVKQVKKAGERTDNSIIATFEENTGDIANIIGLCAKLKDEGVKEILIISASNRIAEIKEALQMASNYIETETYKIGTIKDHILPVESDTKRCIITLDIGNEECKEIEKYNNLSIIKY